MLFALIRASQEEYEIIGNVYEIILRLPPTYGDNTNAIEIQIWCALIALLLLQVVHKEHKSKMAFFILAAIVRLHVMNYVSISAIIEVYKARRPRTKKEPDKPRPKQTAPPALQTELEM